MEIYIDEFTPDTPEEWDPGYKYIETLDSGAYGTVIHAVENSTQRECAVKIITKNGKRPAALSRMKQEIEIWKWWKHKNIVEFFGYTENNSRLFIIMEYLQYGNLKKWINSNRNNVTEETSSVIISQILEAVFYLHGKNICHRDIKPENIMLSRKEDVVGWKLIDFGWSVMHFNIVDNTDYCGTLLYMSPEQIGNNKYTTAVDIWSIGIIMYMLLNNGKHPYYIKGDQRVSYIEKVKKNKFVMFKKCSYMAKVLLEKWWDPNPTWRYSAEMAWKHPWISRRKDDEIPETFKDNFQKKKAKELFNSVFITSLFLNHYIKVNVSNGGKGKKIYKVKDEYIRHVQEYSRLKREKFERIKSGWFDVSSSGSNNTTDNNIGNDRVGISTKGDSMKGLTDKLKQNKPSIQQTGLVYGSNLPINSIIKKGSLTTKAAGAMNINFSRNWVKSIRNKNSKHIYLYSTINKTPLPLITAPNSEASPSLKIESPLKSKSKALRTNNAKIKWIPPIQTIRDAELTKAKEAEVEEPKTKKETKLKHVTQSSAVPTKKASNNYIISFTQNDNHNKLNVNKKNVSNGNLCWYDDVTFIPVVLPKITKRKTIHV